MIAKKSAFPGDICVARGLRCCVFFIHRYFYVLNFVGLIKHHFFRPWVYGTALASMFDGVHDTALGRRLTEGQQWKL